MEKNLEFFVNLLLLDAIAHGLRQEIHENCEKMEGKYHLNVEITSETKSEKSTSNQSKLRLNLRGNWVSSMIPL